MLTDPKLVKVSKPSSFIYLLLATGFLVSLPQYGLKSSDCDPTAEHVSLFRPDERSAASTT